MQELQMVNLVLKTYSDFIRLDFQQILLFLSEIKRMKYLQKTFFIKNLVLILNRIEKMEIMECHIAFIVAVFTFKEKTAFSFIF